MHQPEHPTEGTAIRNGYISIFFDAFLDGLLPCQGGMYFNQHFQLRQPRQNSDSRFLLQYQLQFVSQTLSGESRNPNTRFRNQRQRFGGNLEAIALLVANGSEDARWVIHKGA